MTAEKGHSLYLDVADGVFKLRPDDIVQSIHTPVSGLDGHIKSQKSSL